jgi:prevent-host-death family protein
MIQAEDPMRTFGLFEAKQKLSELVDRAKAGERIGITRRGKLAAVLSPAPLEMSLKEAFDDIEQIRKRSRKPRGVSVKSLIEEGRI